MVQKINAKKKQNNHKKYHLYDAVTEILELYLNNNSSLKNLCFSTKYNLTPKALYALSVQVLKFKPVLVTILHQCVPESFAGRSLRTCFLPPLYDLLFNNKINKADRANPGTKVAIKVITKRGDDLKEAFAKLKSERDLDEMIEPEIREKLDQASKVCKFLRANRSKFSRKRVIAALIKAGFKQVESIEEVFKSKKSFISDPIVSDIVICNPNAQLFDLDIVKEHKAVIQDRGSCLPVAALDPPRGAFVVDFCAAPGNKSSHAAAQVGEEGTVVAVELDPSRFRTLRNRLIQLIASVQTIEDVSDETTSSLAVYNGSCLDYKNAEATHLIIDPSCSSTGQLSSIDQILSSVERDEENLEALADFQKSCVLHGMNPENYPLAERIVYSTCSFHETENEDVVRHVLQISDENKWGWTLVTAMPDWPLRGINQPETLRSGVETNCNGMFVAVFEKQNE